MRHSPTNTTEPKLKQHGASMGVDVQDYEINLHLEAGYKINDFISGTVVLSKKAYGWLSTVEVKSDGEVTMKSRKLYPWEKE